MKNITRTVFCLATVSVLFSCKKLLETDRIEFINEDKAFETVANCEQGIIGAYAALQGEGNMYLNSIAADEVKTEEFPSDQTVHTWLYGADDITLTRDNTNTYAICYNVIDRVNRVIRALPEADSTRTGDLTLKRRLEGEAVFIRALSHFELFRWYCANYSNDGLAMPMMTEPSIGPQARIGMTPYFAQIESDIARALELIPSGTGDVYRATRLAVVGLRARVALYKRDWATAESAATEYITALPLANRTEFRRVWVDSSNAEIAFKIRRTNLTLRPGNFYRGVSPSATNVGTVTWAPSAKLWEAYDSANDIRHASYLKYEPLLAAQNRRPRLVRKYEGTGYATASENANDYKMFRTGEMILIRAEARAELNKIAEANADLNALRTARITGFTNENYGTREQLIDQVILERFRELAFEGHRFWDLKRRGLAVDRRPVDAPNPNAVSLPAGSFRFVLPIPFYEMQANRLMQQNPNY